MVDGSAIGPIDVNIVEVRKTGFLVGSGIGETTSDDPKAAALSNVLALSRFEERFDVDIELDEAATVTGMRNSVETNKATSKEYRHDGCGTKAAAIDAGTPAIAIRCVPSLGSCDMTNQENKLKSV